MTEPNPSSPPLPLILANARILYGTQQHYEVVIDYKTEDNPRAPDNPEGWRYHIYMAYLVAYEKIGGELGIQGRILRRYGYKSVRHDTRGYALEELLEALMIDVKKWLGKWSNRKKKAVD
jgi:hypothetical protein